jgi:hypothetical protein
MNFFIRSAFMLKEKKYSLILFEDFSHDIEQLSDIPWDFHKPGLQFIRFSKKYGFEPLMDVKKSERKINFNIA